MVLAFRGVIFLAALVQPEREESCDDQELTFPLRIFLSLFLSLFKKFYFLYFIVF